MANLIVCCDGTWNSPDNKDDGELAPTNVRQLFHAVDLTSTTSQKTRYQSGVGSGGIFDKIAGGTVGLGISEDIRDCYQWLATHYHEGDKIYLFGFSRGAFTARSLAGMIGKFGIVKLPDKEQNKTIKRLYRQGYRKGQAIEDFAQDLSFYQDSKNIEFIGVWDTVGALGVPDDKVILNLFDNAKQYRFHDTKLGKHVSYARQALAIDEVRGSFTPTLWDHENDNERIKQLWFPGVHSDVGGGYKENQLSDIALKWMIEEAADKGVVFKSAIVAQIKGDHQGMLHDSHVGAMKVLVSAPRSIPSFLSDVDKFHPSAMKRQEQPPIQQGDYHQIRTLNHAVILDIYAKHPWNWTGIYLEAGKKYQFTATGEWMDASIAAGPHGTDDNDFHFGELIHLAGSAVGKLEEGFKSLFGIEQADFFGTKRVEHADWMSLIGAITDGGNPKPDGTHERLTYFEIGDFCLFEPEKSGYLYCFANDAWGFYGNNRGFVTLTVQAI
ncbi:DUF2235 domain-containing protein [Colwelliaceae bacterium 6471]